MRDDVVTTLLRTPEPIVAPHVYQAGASVN
jgi:hypothetical protein